MRETLSVAMPWLVVVAACCALFLPGIDWGLPSRDVDRHLFGDRTPWTGREILALLPTAESDKGSDVDATPVGDRSRPIVVNATDAQRAQIVQRYRLMSKQPDEFATFKALAEMAGRPGLSKLDPRMYKYGGAWVYPVGGLLRLSAMLGLVELRSDRAYYLDHPEAFGRFYVVARLYSAAWGVVGALAAASITRTLTGDRWLGAIGGVLFATLPVVTTAAREAKPHLAGAALGLLCVCLATRWVQTRRLRWAILTGVACGLSVGMVASMVWTLATPLTAWLVARSRGVPPLPESQMQGREAPATWALPASLAVAAIVYAVTNPFVVYNVLFDRGVLLGNVDNNAGFYRASIAGLWRAIEIFGMATTWPLLLAAVAGTIAMLARRRTADGTPARLLLPATILSLGAFAVFAAGKPAEYARFAMLPAAAACVAAVGGVGVIARRPVRARAAGVGLLGMVAVFAGVSAFVGLLVRQGSHTKFHSFVDDEVGPSRRIGVYYEPAPWSLPPVDLFRYELVLLPRDVPPASALTDELRVIAYPGNVSTELPVRPDDRIAWNHNAIRRKVWPFDASVPESPDASIGRGQAR